MRLSEDRRDKAISSYSPDEASCCLSCPAGGMCVLNDKQDGTRPGSGMRRERFFPRGSYLYRAGGPARGLFLIHRGTVKTVVPLCCGGERVSALLLPGDVAGLESVGETTHVEHAIALADVSTCFIDFDGSLGQSGNAALPLGPFTRLVGRQLREQHALLAILSGTTAEQRLAAFLLHLSTRLPESVAPPRLINVQLTRADLGSCLSCTLETVSRAFSHLQEIGAIKVRGRQVAVMDRAALERAACPLASERKARHRHAT